MAFSSNHSMHEDVDCYGTEKTAHRYSFLLLVDLLIRGEVSSISFLARSTENKFHQFHEVIDRELGSKAEFLVILELVANNLHRLVNLCVGEERDNVMGNQVLIVFDVDRC